MKARTISLALAAALISGCLTLPACASKKFTPETPKAAAAMKADAVVVRINELQAAAIEACGPAPECNPAGGIPTATFRTLVKTFIAVRTPLKAVPDGWQTTVKSAWTQARPQFAAITNPSILAALALVDVLIGGL